MSGNNSVTRVFVGHLSSQTRTRDLERTFRRYGRVCQVDRRCDGYAFVDLRDYRDAVNAANNLNGIELDGRRITVEFASGEARCASCGIYGHSAQVCKGCYLCGERGHTARNCMNPHKDIRRELRSPSPNLGPSPSRRRRSYRTPPMRDLRRERDRSVSQNHPSQGPQDSPPSRRCFKRGLEGHLSWDCKECYCYRCGDIGHTRKDCMNVYTDTRRERRHMSPSPSSGPCHSRRRQSYRSPSPSRHSQRRRSYRAERDGHVSRSTRQTHSPSPRARNRGSYTEVRIGSRVQGLVNSSPIHVNKDRNVLPRDRSGSHL